MRGSTRRSRSITCAWHFPVVLVLLLLASGHTTNGCIHDSLQHTISSGHQLYSADHSLERHIRERRLDDQHPVPGDPTNYQSYGRAVGNVVASEVYKPIRIKPYYDNSTLDLLPDDKRDVLLRIIPDAIREFTLALQVVPVLGNLIAQHSCDVQWMTTPTVCKTFVADEMCFEMKIPDEHFGSTKRCDTCLTQGCELGDCSYSEGQGVADTDFVLYVRAADSRYCDGQVLAYATSCQKDQFDRPTFGMTNFCPAQLSSDPKNYDTQVATALHELTHALGFSAQYFAYMRHPDGTPRTPRDLNGSPQTLSTPSDPQCPNTALLGENSSGSNTSTAGNYAVPSTSTIVYSNERDQVVAKLVTPTVAAFVQAHFNCSTLVGAELESQDTGCVGSHWEERLFEPEYMTPVSSFRNVFSGLTLAYFEDSGWYHTNQSRAQRLYFGEKRGCSFATEKCIDPETAKPIANDHYCTDNEVESCSLDATSRSVCAISTGKSGIPGIYQYFRDDKTKGGDNEFADFCPLNVGFSLGDCTVADNLALAPETDINILGETYCPTCRCTVTSLRSSDSSAWIVSARRQTGCYAMRCIFGDDVGSDNDVGIALNGTTVEMTIARSQTGDVLAVNCTSKGEQVQVPGFSGFVTCPDPSVICGNGMTDTFTSALGTRMTIIDEQTNDEAGKTLRSVSSSSCLHCGIAHRLIGVAWVVAMTPWLHLN
jgi:leishmanolysin-like peptidase